MNQWLADAAATRSLGGALARHLRGRPAIVLLRGPLGAGKTCLTQGLGRALGIDEPITSPTFALAQHYRGRRGDGATALVHLDLYRLELPAAADDLFAQEEEAAREGNALMVVEWPERLSREPEDAWRVDLDLEGDGRRARIVAPPGAAPLPDARGLTPPEDA
jgi:tRNA threonylcarbamoyladenosine biosynthesis protein TsaE